MIASLLQLEVDSRLNHCQMFRRKLRLQEELSNSQMDLHSVDGLLRTEKLLSSQSAAFLNLKKGIQELKKMVQVEKLKQLEDPKLLNLKKLLRKSLMLRELQSNLQVLALHQKLARNQQAELEDTSLFLHQEKVDLELPPQTTKLWQNSKEWLISLRKSKPILKNLKVKFQLLLKKSANSEFFKEMMLYTLNI